MAYLRRGRQEEVHVVLVWARLKNRANDEKMKEQYFLVAVSRRFKGGETCLFHPYAPGGIPGGGAGATMIWDLVSDNG